VTLKELLEAAEGGLSGVGRSVGADGSTIWSGGAQAFAVLSADGGAAEFSLDPAVATAAAKTPDTIASPRGAGWVLFRPVELDAHGSDRASAWFASAYRRAAALSQQA
jgi:hypothetical protein